MRTHLAPENSNTTNCSTTYTPPGDQTIDIQKPVIFIQAETETRRMVLTCTRNVGWSQCHALNPGIFLARTDHGHFEVRATFAKGKQEWVRFDIVQQTAIPQMGAPGPSAKEAETNSGTRINDRWGRVGIPSAMEVHDIW